MKIPATDRRKFIKTTAVGGAAISLSGLMPLQAKPVKNLKKFDKVKLPSDPLFTSTKQLATMIKSGEMTSVQLTKMFYNRIDEVNPKINAVVMMCRERAMMEAEQADEMTAKGKSKGPLHGVPMTIKDSLETEGVISTGGTMGRKNFIPGEDATVVSRLRQAGAILIGKTNTPEFTLSGTTANLIYGMTSNPYKKGYSPGGSSGGAGAIIAAGGSPMDIGSDFGGSIRGPAHFCGISGLKPTTGRVPRTGHIVDYGGLFDAYQVLGPLSRWVEDLDYILPIISGPDRIDAAIHPVPLGNTDTVDLSSLKYAWFIDHGSKESCTDATVSAIEDVVAMLRGANFSLKQDAPVEQIRRAEKIRYAMSAADGRAWVRRLVEREGTRTTHPLLRLGDAEDMVSAEEFTAMVERLDASRSEMLQWLKSYDIIVCPVDSSPAEPNPETFERGMRDPKSYGYRGIFNLTGWPAAVVRAGTSPDGLPIGVQIVGRPWMEHQVLAVASFIEAQTGGWNMPAI